MNELIAGLTRIIHEHMNYASVSQSFIRFANKALANCGIIRNVMNNAGYSSG